MGADIHTFIETFDTKNNSWIYNGYNTCEDRGYFLFGYLAGVRNYSIVPIFKPRGFPKDVSEIFLDPDSRESGCHRESHSRSYLTLKEIQDSFKDYAKFYKNCIPTIDLDEIDAKILKWYKQQENVDTDIITCYDITYGDLFKKYKFFTELEAYAKEKELLPEHVRVIFYFDN